MPGAKLKCTGCKDRFPREQMINTRAGNFCSSECILEYSRKPAAVKKVAKVKHQARKENHLPWQIERTRRDFNRFIVTLDEVMPCISCGRHREIYHCGHFKTVAAFPQLRFHPANAFKQCAGCNLKTKHSKAAENTMEQDYALGLVARCGQEHLDWINGPHPMTNPTASDLQLIRKLVNEEWRVIRRDGWPTRDWHGFRGDTLLEIL
tara:strand:- start:1223 stop:1843 length:621 start_codon:yes stop_codon:yes gene_type:complete